ncbi:ubiquitin fusion degradation 1 [Abeliophyllum distichum]|uniref:Ubiquitin fusion degradation 1 n=1 Tax=Abeliophyllum distichum TaxID=126358 RepID=A0ABD1UPX1_9LAMI
MVEIKHPSSKREIHETVASFDKIHPTLEPKRCFGKKNLRNFSCWSTGDTIMINHNDEKFFINILETKLGPAICLIGTDCEADFSTPLDYNEPEKPAKVEQNAPAQVQKKEIEERPVFRPFMGKGRRLDGEPIEIVKDDYLLLFCNYLKMIINHPWQPQEKRNNCFWF